VVVKVETWARGRGRRPEKVTEGVFTFVAIDDEGHPRPLPEEAAEA
jgi:acyl-CoA thioesterase YciA